MIPLKIRGVEAVLLSVDPDDQPRISAPVVVSRPAAEDCDAEIRWEKGVFLRVFEELFFGVELVWPGLVGGGGGCVFRFLAGLNDLRA